jgi:hypothetical protein
MQVSLKEARRIERRIHERGLRKGYSFDSGINIFSDIPVETELDLKSEEVERRVEACISLLSARTTIRRSIQIANGTSGIDDLISTRDMYIKMLCVWEDVREAGEDMKPENVIVRTVENRRARAEEGKENSIYGNQDVVNVTAISEELYNKAGIAVRECQRQIDHCDDQLAALNASTKIEIASDIVKLLKEQEIL